MYNNHLMVLPPITDKEKDLGICSILVLQSNLKENPITREERSDLFDELHLFLEEKGWHSGCRRYPILPPEDEFLGLSDRAYYDSRSCGTLWDESSGYAERRWETYQHLDQYLYQSRGFKEVLDEIDEEKKNET